MVVIITIITVQHSFIQWEFQDPKMEVLYHIGLIYGRYLQFRILEWPLIHGKEPDWKWDEPVSAGIGSILTSGAVVKLRCRIVSCVLAKQLGSFRHPSWIDVE